MPKYTITRTREVVTEVYETDEVQAEVGYGPCCDDGYKIDNRDATTPTRGGCAPSNYADAVRQGQVVELNVPRTATPEEIIRQFLGIR